MKKTILLFSLFVSLAFDNVSKAQTFNYSIDNSACCTVWDVNFYNGTTLVTNTTILGFSTIPAGSCITGTITHVEFIGVVGCIPILSILSSGGSIFGTIALCGGTGCGIATETDNISLTSVATLTPCNTRYDIVFTP